jgi:AcrR family transcriptional regulator
MVTARPARRTQEERSAETRRRILDAAVDCLASLGYAGTTTTEVADRAGVSRGAQLHHFPTRQELVSAAVQHLFAGMTAAYEKSFASLSPDADRVGSAIELLWDVLQDARLAAVLELYVAARTDAALRRAIEPVAAAHHANVVRLARAYFPESAAVVDFELVLDLVLDALQGAAVRSLVTPGEAAVKRTVDAVAELARAALASNQRPTAGSAVH